MRTLNPRDSVPFQVVWPIIDDPVDSRFRGNDGLTTGKSLLVEPGQDLNCNATAPMQPPRIGWNAH